MATRVITLTDVDTQNALYIGVDQIVKIQLGASSTSQLVLTGGNSAHVSESPAAVATLANA